MVYKRFLAWFLFLLFTFFLLYRMLFYAYQDTYRTVSLGYQYNLYPFKTIYDFVVNWKFYSARTIFMNLIGNIFVFFPFGILLAILYPKRKWRWIIKFSLLFIFVLESIQLLSKRGVFDVDDLLLNTLGILLGFQSLKFLSNKLF